MPLSSIREIYQLPEIQTFVPTNLGNDPHLYGVDLDFNGHSTQHSTHIMHPYVAAINPPLARVLIDTYVPKGESVLDPFCGGGGVFVESVLSGRPCGGGDVNPLGVLLSKAKTQYIPAREALDIFNEICAFIQKNENLSGIPIDDKTKFWFKEENINQLGVLSNAVKVATSGNQHARNLFFVVLSATIRDSMLTYRGEVRLRRLQGVDYDRFNPDPFQIFKRRGSIAVERVSALPINSHADVEIRDIRSMPFADESFHSLICSPPYADDKNGVGYFQFSKNMLYWLGFSADELKKYREMFLGTVKTNKLAPKSDSLAESLENVRARNKSHYTEAVAFYSDYDLGLREMARTTKRWIVIVIGNRVLSRTQFDNAQITIDLFKNLGIHLQHHYTRDLRKKRIANLGGDGGGIAKEHILVFRK